MGVKRQVVPVRTGTTTDWASGPTLKAGEIGLDTTKGIMKVGDGSTAFASLATLNGGQIRTGQTTLVGGTKVVADPAITANSKVFLSVHSVGGTAGWLQQSNRTPGTSFTILSSSGTDTSVIDYLIVEP